MRLMRSTRMLILFALAVTFPVLRGSAHPAIAVNTGTPVNEIEVVDTDASGRLVYYEKKPSQAWTHAIISSAHAAYSSPGIAVVGADGYTQIAVEGANHSLLGFARYPGKPWTVAKIANINTTFSDPSVAVRQDNGEINIAVQGPQNSLVFYYGNPNCNCQHVTVAGAGTTFAAPNLFVRSAPSWRIRIAAVGPSKTLYYYAPVGPYTSPWTPLQIGNADIALASPAVAVRSDDESDVVVVGPEVSGGGALQDWVAQRPVTTWNPTTLNAGASALIASNMAVRLSNPPDEIDVAHVIGAGKLTYYYQLVGHPFSAATLDTSTTFSEPAIAVAPSGRVDVVVEKTVGPAVHIFDYHATPGSPFTTDDLGALP